MKHQTKRTTSGATRKGDPQRSSPLLAGGLRQQIDHIYLQLDDQLTRMAQIQLQFDRLRSKLKLL